jgi:hypothetical protein
MLSQICRVHVRVSRNTFVFRSFLRLVLDHPLIFKEQERNICCRCFFFPIKLLLPILLHTTSPISFFLVVIAELLEVVRESPTGGLSDSADCELVLL